MNSEILKSIVGLDNAQFASLTYTSKSDGGTARYTVILGASYAKLLEKSKLELELAMNELEPALKDAAVEVMKSLDKSIAAHNAGTQSEDYTKKGLYVHLCNGLTLNPNDGVLHLFGLIQSKVVLVEGERKPVKSSPMTIAKNKIRKMLSIAKFREFSISAECLEKLKVNGQTIEF